MLMMKWKVSKSHQNVKVQTEKKRIFCPKLKVSFQFLECDDDKAVQNCDVNLEEVEQQPKQNEGTKYKV